MSESIPLITIQPPQTTVPGDRLGGVQHGVVASTIAKVTDSIQTTDFSDRLSEIVAKLGSLPGKLQSGVAGFEVDEITISLAITAEGHIGIATAGVEASIEVSLKRK